MCTKNIGTAPFLCLRCNEHLVFRQNMGLCSAHKAAESFADWRCSSERNLACSKNKQGNAVAPHICSAGIVPPLQDISGGPLGGPHLVSELRIPNMNVRQEHFRCSVKNTPLARHPSQWCSGFAHHCTPKVTQLCHVAVHQVHCRTDAGGKICVQGGNTMDGIEECAGVF